MRSGPVFSQTSPNWKLALGVDYSINRFVVGLGVDMVVSARQIPDSTGNDVRMNVFGFFTDASYAFFLKNKFTLSGGFVLGARTVTYETPSNNSFNPTDWIPFIPSSPLGSAMHFVAYPYLQLMYSPSAWIDITSRLGYDVHVGRPVADVSASSLSGASLQVGFRLAIGDI